MFPARAAQPTVLQPGQTYTREIKAEEKQFYEFTLPAGQYAQLLAIEQGVELSFAVYDAGDTRVASSERYNVLNGPKRLHLVNAGQNSAAVYRVEISAVRKDVLLGRYHLTWVINQPATARAELLCRAQAQFSRARQLIKQQPPDRPGARAQYQSALQFYREADDLEGQALTLTELALVSAPLGDNQQAVEYCLQALPLWRKAGDQPGEARTLNNLGTYYHNQAQREEARLVYEQALPLWRALGDRNGEARTNLNLGLIYSYLGEAQQALDFYEQAAQLWQTGGDASSRSWVYSSSGQIYAGLGDYTRALDNYRLGLAAARSAQDLEREAQLLNDMGEAYLALRDANSATQHLQAALTLRRQTHETRAQATTLTNLALVAQLTAQPEEALRLLEEALRVARAAKHHWVEAEVLSHLGELHAATDAARGRALLEQAVALNRAFGRRQIEALTLYRLARLEAAQGQLAAAQSHALEALDLLETLRGRVADQTLRASFFASQQDYFELCTDLLMRQPDDRANPQQHAREAWRASERGRARTLRELLIEARANLTRGVPTPLLTESETLRRRLAERSQLHLELLENDAPAPHLSASEAELRRLTGDYQRSLARIRVNSPQYDALTPPPAVNLNEVQARLDGATALVHYALGQERSYVWLIEHDRFASFTLPARTVIEAAATRVTESITARQQKVAGETLAQETARWHRADAQYGAAARELSTLILQPLAAQLGQKRLVIVPDGALHGVSFAALPDPSARARGFTPLIAAHELLYLPAASMLVTQPPTRALPLDAAAIFANPVFSATDARVHASNARGMTPMPHAIEASLSANTERLRGQSFDALPNSRREAQALAALFKPGAALLALDFAASRATVLATELKRYPLLHFATHARLDSTNPALSGIVLSQVKNDGARQDGFLLLQDIYNLDLQAELVTLSACQTARGQVLRGEGVIGLTRGFLHSGARRVLASLWSVPDSATPDLMGHFYRALLQQKLSPAAALRHAQLTMWRQQPQRSPYYWAAFTLHGSW